MWTAPDPGSFLPLAGAGETHRVVTRDDVRLARHQHVAVVVGVRRCGRVIQQPASLRRLARQDRRAVGVEANRRRCPVPGSHEGCPHRCVGSHVHARVVRRLAVDRVAELHAVALRHGRGRPRRVLDRRGRRVSSNTGDDDTVADVVAAVRLVRVTREREAVRLVAVREVGVTARHEAAEGGSGRAVGGRVAVRHERQAGGREAGDGDDRVGPLPASLVDGESQRRGLARVNRAGREVRREAVGDEADPADSR